MANIKTKSDFNWWQMIFYYILGLRKFALYSKEENDTSRLEFKWGDVYLDSGFKLEFMRGGYFDQNCKIVFAFIYPCIWFKLPFKTKLPPQCESPRYGFYSLDGKQIVWVWGRKIYKSWDYPFFSRKVCSRVAYTPRGWERYKKGKVPIDKLPSPSARLHFVNVTRSGVEQHCTATIVEERIYVWRKWLGLFKKVDIRGKVSFSKAEGATGEWGGLGSEAGSWKGGTTGTWIDLDPKLTLEENLRKYESTCPFP